MALEKEVGVKPELGKAKNVGFTVRTITPAVYLTGQYNAKATAKATELTRLFSALLELGIWTSTEEAFYSGVPVGTFILVDNGRLAAVEANAAVAGSIQVKVVTAFKRKRKEEAALA